MTRTHRPADAHRQTIHKFPDADARKWNTGAVHAHRRNGQGSSAHRGARPERQSSRAARPRVRRQRAQGGAAPRRSSTVAGRAMRGRYWRTHTAALRFPGPGRSTRDTLIHSRASGGIDCAVSCNRALPRQPPTSRPPRSV
ncbi:unnamed protein product, partial [Iphiclides podalirius]